MRIRSLYLHHFRNYEEAYFEFDPQFNILLGSNAQGKTSLLEAIHYLMIGRSFRTSQSSELIKQGTPSFFLEALFSKHEVEQRLRISYNNQERKVIYNSTPLPTISSLLGIVQGVVMTPDDIQLIKGPPLLRRQFLDVQIAQVDPLYVHHLTRYNRAMRQRNLLLKGKQLLTIESWEHEMSHSAAYIIQQRMKTVQELQVCCQQTHHALTGDEEPLGIIYRTVPVDASQLADIQRFQFEQFNKYRPREMVLGHTLTGPHKEDLTFTIGEKDVRHFASEGQQRTCVTALHLAEWQHLQHRGEETPLMMIDDVGMNLDASRRAYLLEQLSGLGQIFLSTTDETILQSIPGQKKVIRIQKGTIVS